MIFSTNDIDFLKELMPVQNLRNTFALHCKNIKLFLHQIRFETVCGKQTCKWTENKKCILLIRRQMEASNYSGLSCMDPQASRNHHITASCSNYRCNLKVNHHLWRENIFQLTSFRTRWCWGNDYVLSLVQSCQDRPERRTPPRWWWWEFSHWNTNAGAA